VTFANTSKKLSATTVPVVTPEQAVGCSVQRVTSLGHVVTAIGPTVNCWHCVAGAVVVQAVGSCGHLVMAFGQ